MFFPTNFSFFLNEAKSIYSVNCNFLTLNFRCLIFYLLKIIKNVLFLLDWHRIINLMKTLSDGKVSKFKNVVISTSSLKLKRKWEKSMLNANKFKEDFDIMEILQVNSFLNRKIDSESKGCKHFESNLAIEILHLQPTT